MISATFLTCTLIFTFKDCFVLVDILHAARSAADQRLLGVKVNGALVCSCRRILVLCLCFRHIPGVVRLVYANDALQEPQD